MQAGRVGDEAKCPEDGHACPGCKHVTVGPSKKGSPDVYINNQAALRVGDPGEHTETCCGDNTWRAKTGSSTVTINGLPLHRVGDETEHCGGNGKLITGSSDVSVGSGGNGARSEGEKKGLSLEVTDAFGRSLQGVTARVLSPDGVQEVKFDGKTSLSGMHRGTTVIVEKALQQSKADGGAVKGIVPNGTRMITPRVKPASPSPSSASSSAAAPAPAAMTQAAAPTPAPASAAAAARSAAAPTPAPAPAPATQITAPSGVIPGATAPVPSTLQPPASPTGGAAAPVDNFRNADVPASNGTSTDPGLATVHRPEGQTVNVTQFTVHNWVEAVYKAFNIPFPTGVWETATLGVREASMLARNVAGEDAIVKSEELAGQGKTSAEGGNGTAKMAGVTRTQSISASSTKFDDALYIVWTESKVETDQKVEVFQCTIDPGVGSKTKGHPYLLEGHEYQLDPTVHKAAKYPNPYGGGADAYRVHDKGKATTSVVRMWGKRYIDSKDDQSGPMVWRNEDPAINMHFAGGQAAAMGENAGAWSAGCTVLRHGLKSRRYARFVKIIHTSKRKPRPYLVVSSQYVRLYHEWVDYCKGDKTKAQDPKSVLKEDALKEREINGKYIPSILETKYAKANPNSVAPALFTTAQ